MTTSISTFRSALLAATLVLCPLAAALHAQTPQAIRVKVPFAFQNGSQTLPAGVYTITRVNASVFSISGSAISGLTMVRPEESSLKAGAPSKLVFLHYGDKYFLHEVWRNGSYDHAVCIQSTAETKAQKAPHSELASTTAPASTTVEVSFVYADR